ncbi:MAG: hypothetical protein DMF68_01530 [Acidobacteria bacterium]|nr:MAG: hypothetical protein DMF68_01530 [Acidobacteriota bacterium]
MVRKSAVKIVPDDEPLPVEVIEQAIVDIADGMKKLNSTRLTRKAIVTLLHASSGVNKGTIEIVLNNLELIEHTWLKKK